MAGIPGTPTLAASSLSDLARCAVSNFRSIECDAGFLLPSSVDEWLPEWRLAHFMVEAIDGLARPPAAH